MAMENEAPPSTDDRMARRAPKDKNPDPLAKKLKALMQMSKEDKEKDMSFDEKFKKAGPEKRKVMMKKGGSVPKYKAGGSVSSCSKRADGVAQRGKTKCKII